MSHIKSFIDLCKKFLIEDNNEAREAYNYLMQIRGLSDESIKIHNIGYCPKNISLPKQIASIGEDTDDEKEKKDYSYFIKGKIIIPIYDEFRKLVGFATRSPNTLKESTWWNTPFTKGDSLYLLSLTRRESFNLNKIYLVEGYMDALMLYQHGIKNVASLMGTNLSLRQIGLITRYCSNLCFCYDVDKNNSGQRAQNKSIASINKLNHLDSISVIKGLPEGVDPDQFLIKNGQEAFKNLEVELTADDIKKIIYMAEMAEKGS